MAALVLVRQLAALHALQSHAGVSLATTYCSAVYCVAAQGDIADIAQKSPKDLTVLFEHISGSEQFRKVGAGRKARRQE